MGAEKIRHDEVESINNAVYDARIDQVHAGDGKIDLTKKKDLELLLSDQFHDRLISNLDTLRDFNYRLKSRYEKLLDPSGINSKEAFRKAFREVVGIVDIQERFQDYSTYKPYLEKAPAADLKDGRISSLIGFETALSEKLKDSGVNLDDSISDPSTSPPLDKIEAVVKHKMETDIFERKERLNSRLASLKDEKKELKLLQSQYTKNENYLSEIAKLKNAVNEFNTNSNSFNLSDYFQIFEVIYSFQSNGGMRQAISNDEGWKYFDSAWKAASISSGDPSSSTFNKAQFVSFMGTSNFKKFLDAVDDTESKINDRITKIPKSKADVEKEILDVEAKILKNEEKLKAVEGITYKQYFAEKAFGSMKKSELKALDSQKAAQILSEVIVKTIDPSLENLEMEKMAKLLRAKLIGDHQRARDVDAILERFSQTPKDFSKLKGMQRINFQRKVLKFKPKGESGKTLAKKLKLSFEDFETEKSVGDLINSGRLVEGSGTNMKLGYGFSLLAALIEFGGTTAQSDQIKEYLFKMTAEKLEASSKMDNPKVQDAVQRYFDEQYQRVKGRYSKHKYKVKNTKEKYRTLTEIRLRDEMKVLLKKWRAGNIEEWQFKIEFQKLKNKIEENELDEVINLDKYELLSKIWDNPKVEKFLRSWSGELARWLGEKAKGVATATGKAAGLGVVRGVVGGVKLSAKGVLKVGEYGGRTVFRPLNFTANQGRALFGKEKRKFNGPIAQISDDVGYVYRRVTDQLTKDEAKKIENKANKKEERAKLIFPDRGKRLGYFEAVEKYYSDDWKARSVNKKREDKLKAEIEKLEKESDKIKAELKKDLRVDMPANDDLEVDSGTYIAEINAA